jgi:hypothetical protein
MLVVIVDEFVNGIGSTLSTLQKIIDQMAFYFGLLGMVASF